MSRPRWLDYTSEDLSGWLAQPQTQDFLAWLLDEAANAKDLIAHDVVYDGGLKAKILGGRLTAIEDILRSTDKPQALPAVPDEPFRDPAERKRKNSETHTARTSDDSGTE